MRRTFLPVPGGFKGTPFSLPAQFVMRENLHPQKIQMIRRALHFPKLFSAPDRVDLQPWLLLSLPHHINNTCCAFIIMQHV